MNSKQEQAASNEEFDINADENQSGSTHLNEPVESESEIERLKAELEESKDKFIRKVAEFENLRRRSIREREELTKMAGADVISKLLEVLDDCDRAQAQLDSSDDSPVKEGVQLVFNKLRNVLTSLGLKPMDAKNTEFDPDLHEAITEIPAPTPDLEGKVVDEVIKGYYLNDKIIRHAKVVVGKKAE